MWLRRAFVRVVHGGVTFLLPPTGEIPRLELAAILFVGFRHCTRAHHPRVEFSEYDSVDSGVANDQGPERWRSTPGRDEARGNSGGSPKRL